MKHLYIVEFNRDTCNPDFAVVLAESVKEAKAIAQEVIVDDHNNGFTRDPKYLLEITSVVEYKNTYKSGVIRVAYQHS